MPVNRESTTFLRGRKYMRKAFVIHLCKLEKLQKGNDLFLLSFPGSVYNSKKSLFETD